MFVYQSTFDMFELQKQKSADQVFSQKSKGVYTSKLKSLYTAFLHSIKCPGYRVGLKFDTDSVAVENKNTSQKL